MRLIGCSLWGCGVQWVDLWVRVVGSGGQTKLSRLEAPPCWSRPLVHRSPPETFRDCCSTLGRAEVKCKLFYQEIIIKLGNFIRHK